MSQHFSHASVLSQCISAFVTLVFAFDPRSRFRWLRQSCWGLGCLCGRCCCGRRRWCFCGVLPGRRLMPSRCGCLSARRPRWDSSRWRRFVGYVRICPSTGWSCKLTTSMSTSRPHRHSAATGLPVCARTDRWIAVIAPSPHNPVVDTRDGCQCGCVATAFAFAAAGVTRKLMAIRL